MTTATSYKSAMKNPTGVINMKKIRRQLRGNARGGGMTREEFALALGVSRDTIGRWERGEFNISRLAREKLERLVKDRGLDGR